MAKGSPCMLFPYLVAIYASNAILIVTSAIAIATRVPMKTLWSPSFPSLSPSFRPALSKFLCLGHEPPPSSRLYFSLSSAQTLEVPSACVLLCCTCPYVVSLFLKGYISSLSTPLSTYVYVCQWEFKFMSESSCTEDLQCSIEALRIEYLQVDASSLVPKYPRALFMINCTHTN